MGFVSRMRSNWIDARAQWRMLRHLREFLPTANYNLSRYVHDRAKEIPGGVALRFEDQSFTWKEVDERSNQYARFFQSKGVGQADVVSVLMDNRPEFVFAAVGLNRLRAIAALINTNITGAGLTHAVNVVGLAYLAPRKKVNQFLSLMRFSEMDLKQRIGTLSGGQRARVALAQCLLSGAATIVLDEPTNHLDVTSTQVMERALLHFPGAVIVVSHDRFFIDKVATRLLIFEEQGVVREVAGNWTLWQASLG